MVTLFCVNNEALSKPANISVGDMTEMAQKSERDMYISYRLSYLQVG